MIQAARRANVGAGRSLNDPVEPIDAVRAMACKIGKMAVSSPKLAIGFEVRLVHPYMTASGLVCHNARVKWFQNSGREQFCPFKRQFRVLSDQSLGIQRLNCRFWWVFQLSAFNESQIAHTWLLSKS